jgi:uncharacterized protein YunC (DUF1805 family)
VTPATELSPLKGAGYALAVPPRQGTWRIEPAVSFIQLRLRSLCRRSVFTAPVGEGAVRLTAAAATSAIDLRFDPYWSRRGNRQAAHWLDRHGFGNVDVPAVFGSSILLASPDGWRMCGRLRAQHLDAVLVADVRITDVRTRADGRDAMLVNAIGVISRGTALGVTDFTLGPRVAVWIRAQLVHD